ncbi:hypothetical protein AARAC_000091 [Aspergillus arachidicola]|uniref:Extracellular membrane protein CFEM domain-containing protein n=1 Tax=Aspergillus arachidicola TaxID=656916 RepID=A0A2G7FNK7_9EURO|nr:hypothetical protein AARAC_000091 [Aspergillus arachidicola]
MKATALILGLLNVAIVSAVPTSMNNLLSRGDSGCTAFSDPDCGVDGTFCQCKDGNFYQFNQDAMSCQPPWAIIGPKSSLPGWRC